MKIPHIIMAAVLCAATTMQTSCSGGSASDQYADIDLIPVKVDSEGKWSLVNHKGEVVYDGEFSERPSCAVNGFFSVEEGEGYTVYKIGGKNPEAVDGLEKLKYVGYVSDGLIPVTKKDSRITVMKPTGEVAFELTPWQNTEIVWCAEAFAEGMLRFRTEENKYGYYNTKGEVVINPVYDSAADFNEGLAVVSKNDDKNDGDRKYTVINKKGETVFKIKDGISVESPTFKDGYLLLQEDDRYILCNEKGELNKLSSKIKRIEGYNDKYIIYRGENGYGVCDINGEIIIRPKYKSLMFNTSSTFFAQKDGSDDEIIVLDKTGEEMDKPLDFNYIHNTGKFGYIALENKTWVMLGSDYKPKGKDEYYSLSMNKTPCYSINSDYFDITAIARNIVDLIKGNKVGDISLGSPASQVLKGKTPSEYKYQSTTSVDNFNKTYFNYRISGSVEFTTSICSDEWDYNNYSYRYFWNPDAKVLSVDIKMSCDKEWGISGHKALMSALNNAGFKTISENNEQSSLLKNGKTLVICISQNESAMLIVIDGSLDGIEQHLKDNLNGIVNNFSR